jgi:homoserine kinase type II
MKYVYKLKHSRKVDDECTSSVLIGFFESEKLANEIIIKYKKLPGFKDYPNDFVAEKVEIDFDDWEFEDEN